MFNKVALGVIAVSTVGFQIWIGLLYKEFLSELSEKNEDSGSEDFDFDWANLYGDIEKLKKGFGDF